METPISDYLLLYDRVLHSSLTIGILSSRSSVKVHKDA
jgi:hypothetical protein